MVTRLTGARRRAATLKGGPTIILTDGTKVRIPPEEPERFKGLDFDGDMVYAADWDPTYLFALTPCCLATGKGSEDGIVCRNCYRPVSWKFGGTAEVDPRKGVPQHDGTQ
jgi:hypothetical protein